jgi:hypothetical protein
MIWKNLKILMELRISHKHKRRIRLNVFKKPKWCQSKRGQGKKGPMMTRATINAIGSFDFAFFFLLKSKI